MYDLCRKLLKTTWILPLYFFLYELISSKEEKKRKYFHILVLRWCNIFKPIIHYIFGSISMQIKMWNQYLVCDFPIYPSHVMSGVMETFLLLHIYCISGVFWVSTVFTDVNFLFFQNPVKKIPDSHEITLQHGTKTVSDVFNPSCFSRTVPVCEIG